MATCMLRGAPAVRPQRGLAAVPGRGNGLRAAAIASDQNNPSLMHGMMSRIRGSLLVHNSIGVGADAGAGAGVPGPAAPAGARRPCWVVQPTPLSSASPALPPPPVAGKSGKSRAAGEGCAPAGSFCRGGHSGEPEEVSAYRSTTRGDLGFNEKCPPQDEKSYISKGWPGKQPPGARPPCVPLGPASSVQEASRGAEGDFSQR